MFKNSELEKIIQHPAINCYSITYDGFSAFVKVDFTMSSVDYSLGCIGEAPVLEVNNEYFPFDNIDNSTVEGKLRFMLDDDIVLELPINKTNPELLTC